MNIILFQILRQQSSEKMHRMSKEYGKDAWKKPGFQEAYELWSKSIEGLRRAKKEVEAAEDDPFWSELASIGTEGHPDNPFDGIKRG